MSQGPNRSPSLQPPLPTGSEGRLTEAGPEGCFLRGGVPVCSLFTSCAFLLPLAFIFLSHISSHRASPTSSYRCHMWGPALPQQWVTCGLFWGGRGSQLTQIGQSSHASTIFWGSRLPLSHLFFLGCLLTVRALNGQAHYPSVCRQISKLRVCELLWYVGRVLNAQVSSLSFVPEWALMSTVLG